MMKHAAILTLLCLTLTACMPGGRDDTPPLVVETLQAGGPVAVAPPPSEGADVPLATPAPASEGRFLGFSVTSLGDASVPGLWLETPLVKDPMTGRIVAENGRQIAVELRPTGGARGSGSRLSLEGFTALGLPLTALTTMTVIGDA